jgi:PhnB protein
MQAFVSLSFPGYGEEALAFYQAALGGTIERLSRWDSVPGSGLPPEALVKLIHAELVLPSGTRIFVNDYFEKWAGPQVQGTTMTVSLMATSEEQAREVFAKLSVGGKVNCPIEKSFWNAIYGHFIDKYGVPWQINFDLPSEVDKQ